MVHFFFLQTKKCEMGALLAFVIAEMNAVPLHPQPIADKTDRILLSIISFFFKDDKKNVVCYNMEFHKIWYMQVLTQTSWFFLECLIIINCKYEMKGKGMIYTLSSLFYKITFIGPRS